MFLREPQSFTFIPVFGAHCFVAHSYPAVLQPEVKSCHSSSRANSSNGFMLCGGLRTEGRHYSKEAIVSVCWGQIVSYHPHTLCPPCGFYKYSSAVKLEIREGDTSTSFFIVHDCLSYNVSVVVVNVCVCYHMKLRNVFSNYVKTVLEFL